MWKTLTSSQSVHPGDMIRYTEGPSYANADTLFRVVKTDQHYFEILHDEPDAGPLEELTKRIVRYFDIGYNVALEVWRDS